MNGCSRRRPLLAMARFPWGARHRRGSHCSAHGGTGGEAAVEQPSQHGPSGSLRKSHAQARPGPAVPSRAWPRRTETRLLGLGPGSGRAFPVRLVEPRCAKERVAACPPPPPPVPEALRARAGRFESERANSTLNCMTVLCCLLPKSWIRGRACIRGRQIWRGLMRLALVGEHRLHFFIIGHRRFTVVEG